MEFLTDGAPVVCVTTHAVLRGRMRRPAESSSLDAPERRGHPFYDDLIVLENVTILDHDRRILKRVPRVLVNGRNVEYFAEDDLTAEMDRIKAMVAEEDYEAAVVDVERLLSVAGPDGEALYLAGLVHHNAGQDERASECFNLALKVTLDPKLRTAIQRHLTGVEV